MSSYDSIEKIWNGPKLPPSYNTDASMGYLILNNLKMTPDRVVQVFHDTGVEMKGKEIYERSIKIIKYLESIGLAENDVAGVLALGSENLFPTVIACLTYGLPINAVSHLMKTDDLVSMWSMTKPKVIFCDTAFLDMVKEAVDVMKIDCKIITMTKRVEGYQFIDDVVAPEDKDIDKFM